MIIGIDGNEANVERRLGVGEITYNLLLHFAKLAEDKRDIRFVIYLKDEPVNTMPEANDSWRYRVLKPGKAWTQWRLPIDLYLHKTRPDVFFTPTHYAPRFSPVPTVISIMDLAYMHYPELFRKRDLYKLRSWTRYSVRNSRMVITISESSKFDIIKEYKKAEDQIEVIYPGIKPAVFLGVKKDKMSVLKSKYNLSDNFVLFVGTLQPRKNIVRLIEAFKKVKSQKSKVKNEDSFYEDLELVIIGKKGWLYEDILATPKRLGIEQEVKFLQDVNDEDLAVFYKNALVYVLPSLYEGFGLPVLEAMQYGCPVITSNVSSLPEAGGDAALYVDPMDIGDIAEKIVKVISNSKLREEMKEKGRKQLKKFSWEKAARETLSVLEKVVKK